MTVKVNVSGNNKPWYKSKTIWAGILQAAGGTALIVAEELSTGGTLTLVGLITIVLRTLTKQEISFQ